ncbi:MAG: hypothetical protein LBC12_07885 [Nitrososphaerota archaeon]|jgi:hypothetical protein|nr:hypothetical protein [Nitrososphaerota archaeon]
MGVNTSFALIDAGYFSEENVKNLFVSDIAFLTCLPAGRKLYRVDRGAFWWFGNG